MQYMLVKISSGSVSKCLLGGMIEELTYLESYISVRMNYIELHRQLCTSLHLAPV